MNTTLTDGLTLLEWRVIAGGVSVMALGFVLTHYHRMQIARFGGLLVPAGAGIVFGVLLVARL
jgi:hypothetical protein